MAGRSQGFRDLQVWQVAKNLAVHVYRYTENSAISRDFGLKDQMRRAAVSIASNIAEGYERRSDKDFVRFLLIAKGSLSELRTQTDIAREVGYFSRDLYDHLENEGAKLAGMLTKLIQYRLQSVDRMNSK